MQSAVENIKTWESVEIKRSASEAKKRQAEDLRINEDIIQRYLNPSSNTPYPLEYAYSLLEDTRNQTVLDYGCGLGDNSVLIARHGGKVIGVDISPELIELAQKRLEQHGLKTASQFHIGSAHELPVENESIDVVFGMAILHHLDLHLSAKEVFRVLKKGGRAIFLEPVRNSKLLSLLRKLIPYQAADISPFERPLTDNELQSFAQEFSSYQSRAFSLPFVNLIEVLKLSDGLQHRAIELDGTLLKKARYLNYYATIRVIEITK